jgi:hypothetical protein
MSGFNTSGNNLSYGRTTNAVMIGKLRNSLGSTTRKFKYCNQNSPDLNVTFNCVFNRTSPPPQLYIRSKNNITQGCFDIGDNLVKDMENRPYNTEPIDSAGLDIPIPFPSGDETVPGNIVQGDKPTDEIYISSYWSDWDGDVLDAWGNFFFFNELSQQYYFPLINPQNQPNGQLFNQTFNVSEWNQQTFSMIQGWPVRGIFKIDISVEDPNFIFRFGTYGNFGSDDNSLNNVLTYPYTLNGNNLTLYYLYHRHATKDTETCYIYFIPKLIAQNNSLTFTGADDYIAGVDKNFDVSVALKYGVIFYISRGNDVRDWVINDLTTSTTFSN